MNIYIILITIITIFLYSFESKAQSATARAIAQTEIIETTIDLEDIGEDLIFELIVDVDDEGNVKDWLNQEKIITKMISDPDTVMKVYYGDRALSKEDNEENAEGYAIVVLTNENGDKLEVKLKIDDSRITFDSDGKGELRVGSDFFVGDNQPKGRYKAVYSVIISY